MKGFEILKRDGKKEINPFKYVYDSDVVKNLITERCQVLKGELPYNTSLGIGLKATKDSLDLDISSIILNTNGVSRIISFESTLTSDHKYTAIINIETVYNNIIEVNL